MEYVLETMGLSKKYGGKHAIANVSVRVRRGDIYGFIGRNGAGKSTFIRLAAGLVSPDGGELRLFGSDNLGEARRRIGTVVEYPALYKNLSARENLELYRRMYGVADSGAVDEILDLTGLSDTGRKAAKRFSLGMKQRLGIGIALLGSPDLLMLDEPMNGLDPTGIKELRELILRLNRERGITIFLSSHILGELAKISTRYGILNNGALVDEFSAEELAVRCRRCLKIQVDDAERACMVLEGELGSTDYDVLNGGVIRLFDYCDNPARVSAALVGGGVGVLSIGAYGEDLEGYFMEKLRSSGR